MVEGKDDEAYTYVNCETGFGNLTILIGLDHLIYISDSDIDEGHQ
jgi:hypothetical protein